MVSNRHPSSNVIWLVVLSLAFCPGGPVTAQAPAEVSGPVDIQADEQEFAGDQVLARGNVRVSYKGSVIVAPAATLFRDAAGNPQKAVFTGHPRLVQGTNLVNADKLTFEIASQKVLAEGNAHSEVVSQTSDDQDLSKLKAGSQVSPGIKKPAAQERIITDSDRQEYDKSSDKFEAIGHVRVRHGDIFVTAERLQLVYGANKKPETALFTGNVVATQGQNKTIADVITYMLLTKRLQASGHVKSQVIQPRKADGAKKGGLFGQPVANGPKDVAASGGHDARAGGEAGSEADDPITIISDAQDYSQETRRMSAEGNVRVHYQDTLGMGPKVILVRNEDGRAEKVIFTGRSQVSQPGRRWIADKITVTVADKKVMAVGNTKALIMQKPGSVPARQAQPGSQLAGRSNAISSTKLEATQ